MLHYKDMHLQQHKINIKSNNQYGHSRFTFSILDCLAFEAIMGFIRLK